MSGRVGGFEAGPHTLAVEVLTLTHLRDCKRRIATAANEETSVATSESLTEVVDDLNCETKWECFYILCFAVVLETEQSDKRNYAQRKGIAIIVKVALILFRERIGNQPRS